MREITLEIPLLDGPLSGETGFRFLGNLLKHTASTYLFRMRGEGFLIICQIPSEEFDAFRKLNAANPSYGVHVKVLDREKSGDTTVQVSGTWQELTKGGNYHLSNIARFMKAIGRKRIYITRNPSFDGKRLHLSLAADEVVMKEMLGGVKSAEVPFRIASSSPSRAREESLLGDLTGKQAEVLRLAYSMGYYDVPKKVGIDEIARLLGKDKGTVGEHLRRAEKHVFDRLLS
jgi:DNA-binding transcriptional ArsR family regulator